MTAPQHDMPVSRRFTLARVGDGVWAAIAIPGAGAMGNAGIIDLGGLTLIFDTMLSLAAAHDLRIAAERLTGRRARYVVNSHYHLDHTMGNTVFDDATIIATTATAPLITEHTDSLLKMMRTRGDALDAEARAEAAAAADPAARRDLEEQADDYLVLLRDAREARSRLPDLRFESRLTLHGDSRHAELITWGGGHTPSDAALYLPHERILFAGDLIFYRMHASMQFGDPVEWTRVLDEMDKLTIETLVPGHGQVTGHGAIAAQRGYLETLLDLGREAIAEGRNAEDVAATPPPEAYRDWGFPSGFGPNMTAVTKYLRERGVASGADQA